MRFICDWFMTWVCLYGVVTYLQFQFTGNQLHMITRFRAFIPVSDVDIRGKSMDVGFSNTLSQNLSLSASIFAQGCAFIVLLKRLTQLPIILLAEGQ